MKDENNICDICCANCKYAVRAEEKCLSFEKGYMIEARNAMAIEFNKTHRICMGSNEFRSYNMYEKRECSHFSANPNATKYYVCDREYEG